MCFVTNYIDIVVFAKVVHKYVNTYIITNKTTGFSRPVIVLGPVGYTDLGKGGFFKSQSV